MQVVRLLLVEDCEINRELLADYFKHAEFEVLSLPDGSHFLDAVAEFKPHLILLDLQLPGSDGFTLLGQLQHSEWSHIPVVVLSAYAFREDKQRAFALGTRQYLVKPASLSEIQQTITEELGNVA